MLLGGVCLVVSAVPVIPWRFSRSDTNVGNRFVMDRYYTLFGATDQMGKNVNWFTLKKKMQRKNEEFGRPSPVTALLGTVGGALGTGGAAMGCAMWQVCKDHVSARYMSYSTVAMCGMVSAACLVIGAVFCGATGVMMGFEETK